jgi:hypothetical protein
LATVGYILRLCLKEKKKEEEEGEGKKTNLITSGPCPCDFIEP